MAVGRFVKNNGLAIAMFGIFFAAIIGLSITGWATENDERMQHGEAGQSYLAYVGSGAFGEAVFENWESEFLQMWALVILTVFLYQKGSADSKPLRGKGEQDTRSRLSIIRASTWNQRIKALGHSIYAHSLGIALLLLFLASFGLHALGGTEAYNEMQRQHGAETVSVLGYLATSQFWYESLQNWQSEFLAVGVLIVLSIYLRERGSQQSKPVGRRYDHTTG